MKRKDRQRRDIESKEEREAGLLLAKRDRGEKLRLKTNKVGFSGEER